MEWTLNWIVNLLRDHSELAIFLTLAGGFWIGKLKFKSFSLGVVTSVLLVGVLVGQMDIPISQPLKSVFFLLFLFAIGYKVGPQFFRGLKKDGLPQVYFAIIMCVVCLAITWGIAKIAGYNQGEAAGLLSGAQTISAVIGVAGDTINGLNISASQKQQLTNIIPVAYAVTYIFGTAGSAWVLASVGPKLLGGIDKVKAACVELEAKMGTKIEDEPAFENARRPVVFRSYCISNEWFNGGKTVQELEDYFLTQNKRLYVERMERDKKVIDDMLPSQILMPNDIVVLSGRREFAIGEEKWIGQEVVDPELLDFPVEVVPVVLANKNYEGITIEKLRLKTFMHGVSIRKITREDISLPIYPQLKLDPGDKIELIGLRHEAEKAGKTLGYMDKISNVTDMVFVSIGILIGGIFGAMAIHLGGVPISLSTSGGALIAGLVFGWWRSKHPDFGHIPEPALWFMNNVGLNMFIAVVGITAGPSFVSGLKEVGWMLLVTGAIATTIPLLVGVLLGRYVFHFHPALTLGCTAGSRTTTAALGAIQEALGSETSSLGYTITYAVGNTLLIIWGVVIVLMI